MKFFARDVNFGTLLQYRTKAYITIFLSCQEILRDRESLSYGDGREFDC